MIHAAFLCVALLSPAALPEGDGKVAVDLGSVTLDVYTYRPKNYTTGPLIVSFHGVHRTAASYRDAAKPLADQLGGIVVAPYFDEKRFPTSLYQRGGVVDKDGRAVPAEERTYALVGKLVDHFRGGEGRPDMDYFLIGHSGGGQFLVRYAAFETTQAVRIVAANPGSHLFANEVLKFPYGFGGLPPELHDEATMKRYLAAPLTLFLGSGDIVRDENLDVTPTADRQGPTRWARGHRSFEIARDLAKAHGWPFNWKIVVADGVGHSAGKMFGNPAAKSALLIDAK